MLFAQIDDICVDDTAVNVEVVEREGRTVGGVVGRRVGGVVGVVLEEQFVEGDTEAVCVVEEEVIGQYFEAVPIDDGVVRSVSSMSEMMMKH